MTNDLDKLVASKAQAWLDGNYDEATKQEVRFLMENNHNELVESFYKDLEFGTGGLRGIMGVGTNRMNIYTVGAATQGLANYLKLNFAGEQIKVAISHDSRNNSRMFAERVADIFASNGFIVYLFDALRPTPELSFAIRELGCQSGVMVTASHNPKEYNGYKAYWNDGSQVTSPHDVNIIAEVGKITDNSQVLTGKNAENIHILGDEFDQKYLAAIKDLSLSPESVAKYNDMKIVYTPLHGAGVKLVPQSLRNYGFNNIICVEEQMVLDGNFPTVASPNPEERKTMAMAIELADKEGADFAMATDPDADRLGVALRTGKGDYVLLNGNQTLVLLMCYQLTRWAELGLYHNTVGVGILNYLAGDLDVLFKGLGGSIDHNGGKTAVNAALAGLKAVAMVQMQSDGQTGLDHSSLNKLGEVGVIGIGAGAAGNLKDQGGAEVLSGLGDALDDLHVVDVESTDGVAAVIGLLEHFFRGYEWHSEYLFPWQIYCKFC